MSDDNNDNTEKKDATQEAPAEEKRADKPSALTSMMMEFNAPRMRLIIADLKMLDVNQIQIAAAIGELTSMAEMIEKFAVLKIRESETGISGREVMLDGGGSMPPIPPEMVGSLMDALQRARETNTPATDWCPCPRCTARRALEAKDKQKSDKDTDGNTKH